LDRTIGLDVMEYLVPLCPKMDHRQYNAYNMRETVSTPHKKRMALFTAAHADLFERRQQLLRLLEQRFGTPLGKNAPGGLGPLPGAAILAQHSNAGAS
jgi:hypothetical protein